MLRARLTLVAALSCAAAPAIADDAPWRAGFASVDITPDSPIVLGGYANRTQPVGEVVAPLFVKAMAVESAAGESRDTAILITADILGYQAYFAEPIREGIATATGVAPERILLSSSHTHTGPILNADARYGMSPEMRETVTAYVKELSAKTIRVAEEAMRDRRPAVLAWGRGVADFVMNRRQFTDRGVTIGVNPSGPVDRAVPVLRVTAPEGFPRGVVFGCACHNTTVGAGKLICGDYAGYAQARLKAALEEPLQDRLQGGAEVHTLFVIGCGGDANPYPRGSVELARKHGESLATEVLRVVGGTMAPVRGPLGCALERVALPFRAPPARDELDRLARGGGWQGHMARRMIEILDGGKSLPSSYVAPVAVWTFGRDLTLVGLPGEGVVDYVGLVERAIGPLRLWVAGYANDNFGYLPSARILAEGGYETRGAIYGGVGVFSPLVEDRIVSSVTRLTRRLRAATSGERDDPIDPIEPIVRVVDLDIGRGADVVLADGASVRVELLAVQEERGEVMNEVNGGRVTLRIDGALAVVPIAAYHLPSRVAGVRIDCPVTRGYRQNSHVDHWALEQDARLRLWPDGWPLVAPGTFGYPVKQAWFASDTWMTNEPVASRPNGMLYYHAGLDIGGAEHLVEVVAATDGLVVARGEAVLESLKSADTPIEPRYDVVYLRDDRGWYYRYSHLASIDAGLELGARVALGDRIGTLGKEGGSGGWTHLHFEAKARQPSGRWGTQEAYPFIWEAYRLERDPKLVAVARPSHKLFAGQSATLDATRSWSEEGIESCEWIFDDGERAAESIVERRYDTPGTYRETLRVTDTAGRVDYDFVRVTVFERERRHQPPPRLHAAFHPTLDLRAGDEITFKVRAFNTTEGEEIWDFGDGSAPVTTRSDGNVRQLAPDGYAIVRHRYESAGDWIVSIRRVDDAGHVAEERLHVRVGPAR